MKETIHRCFNKNAFTYDDAAFIQADVGHKLAKKLPQQATRILEIGCGTGLFSEFLIKLFPKAEIVLSDIAPNMLAQCQKRLRYHPNIQFVCMDGERLTLDNKYDLIVSNMSLHWFTDPIESFNKIMDLLTLNGHFMFAMVGEKSLIEWQTIYEKYKFPNSTPSFPSLEKLKEYFSFHALVSETMTHDYKNAYHFLSSLKKIGAIAAREGVVPLPSGKLRKILRDYSDKLKITYEIIYGLYIKK